MLESAFTIFNNLDAEKKARILNAAMAEFVKNGFKHASTDVMAAQAGISKGSVFHYFHTKKKLFLYLYQYSVDMLMHEFYEKIDLTKRDFFERYRHIMQLKMEMLAIYPELFSFLLVAVADEDHQINGEIARNAGLLYEEIKSKAFANINIGRFRPGIDPEKIMNVVSWTLEGFSNQIVAQMRARKDYSLVGIDVTKSMAEAEKYIDIMKACFYV